MPMRLEVGDHIQTKKKHPCGNTIFKICRIGMDFRIECIHCKRQIWIERTKLEKRIKKVIPKQHIPEPEPHFQK